MSDSRAFEIGGTLAGVAVVLGIVLATAEVVSRMATPAEQMAVGLAGIALALAGAFTMSWLLATLETTHDPPWAPRRWYRRRQRAVCLGHMGHAKAWYDPESGAQWQANSRYALFAVAMTTEGVEDTVKMLKNVHLCTLYVDPQEVDDI